METEPIYLLSLLFILLNIVDLIQTKTRLCYYGPEAKAHFIIRRFYAWFGFGGVVVYNRSALLEGEKTE